MTTPDLNALIERFERWLQNTGFEGGVNSPPMLVLAALRALSDRQPAPLDGEVREIVERLKKTSSDMTGNFDGEYDHWASLCDEAATLIERLSTVQQEAGWQPIETAPYSTPVEVRAGDMAFLARFERNVSMNSDGLPCDQWQAVNEGEHPPCWSGGACWESNEDECESLQPCAWRLPAAPAIRARGEG